MVDALTGTSEINPVILLVNMGEIFSQSYMYSFLILMIITWIYSVLYRVSELVINKLPLSRDTRQYAEDFAICVLFGGWMYTIYQYFFV